MTIHELIKMGLETLPLVEAPVDDLAEVVWWLESRPVGEFHEADRACEQFSMDHTWPDMVPDVRAQTHLRLEAANWMLEQGYIPMADSIPTEESLNILLVQFWYPKCVEWAEHVYGRA